MGGYSIKPGRGPSAFGAAGGIIGALFGVFWTILAIYITADAPWPIVRIIFPLFGVLFIVASIAGALYNAHNAARPNRFSTFDVVPSESEPEPIFGAKLPASTVGMAARPDRYCTKCGAGMKQADKFCSNCGTSVSAT